MKDFLNAFDVFWGLFFYFTYIHFLIKIQIDVIFLIAEFQKICNAFGYSCISLIFICCIGLNNLNYQSLTNTTQQYIDFSLNYFKYFSYPLSDKVIPHKNKNLNQTQNSIVLIHIQYGGLQEHKALIGQTRLRAACSCRKYWVAISLCRTCV